MYQQSLSFDETYEWVRFVGEVIKAKAGSIFRYDGISGRTIIISKAIQDKVYITSNESRLKLVESKIKASKMAVLTAEHIHTYQRSPIRHENRELQIYRCIDPDCRHYAPMHLIRDKRAMCKKCRQPFVIYKQQLTLLNKDLVCPLCSKSKVAEELRTAASVLDEMLNISNGETNGTGTKD